MSQAGETYGGSIIIIIKRTTMPWTVSIFVNWLFYCSLVVAYTKLSSKDTKDLIKSSAWLQSSLDPTNATGFLEPILCPRVPGSENSKKVQKHFINFFNTLHDDWNVSLDTFTDDTPIAQQVEFTNVIATRDPPNAKNVGRIVIAAHYDSKLEPEGFIGAIDSAVPCALIMHAIASIDKQLTELWATNNDDAKKHGIQVVFFDGEEAFHEWSDTDSIYGARHLAEKMAQPVTETRFKQQRSQLDMIDVFVLLDLLGAPNPSIPSYFRETDWLHRKLSAIEDRLDRQDLLQRAGTTKIFARPPMFQYGGLIGDDHMPFLRRGTSVLHLIPLHFPPVWHKITDNANHLDMDSVYDWAKILPVFLAEYLDIGMRVPKPDL